MYTIQSRVLFVLLVNVILNMTLTLLIQAQANQATKVTPQPALTVKTTQIGTVLWPVTITANGGLYPWQEAVIASETSGLRIAEILVDVGYMVKKGQILARLAKETVEATLAQRRAELAQAQAGLAQARSDAARAKRARGALSEQQVEQYNIAQDRAAAAVEAAKAALLNEQIRLEKTTVVAVDDGIVASRSAMLGSVVQMGTELFRLVRQSRIEWRAEVTAQQLAHIQLRQVASVELPSGQILTGKVRLLAPTLDPKTRMGLVYVDLPVDSPAKAGMFARGIITSNSTKATVLPTSAVIVRDGFSYVFIVNDNHTVRQIKVVTGRLQKDLVEIISDVDPDADIVLAGGAFLENGDKVSLMQ
ncbi:hypothetical protein TI04_03360 [Achromatium sp. WMS2]|nr:hypothetical protein TI04_03360 [Achromatium sp. WMS2]